MDRSSRRNRHCGRKTGWYFSSTSSRYLVEQGWFASWGDNRPAGNWPDYDSTGQSAQKSQGILTWVARGGSHVNFYNWAGTVWQS